MISFSVLLDPAHWRLLPTLYVPFTRCVVMTWLVFQLTLFLRRLPNDTQSIVGATEQGIFSGR